MTVDVERLRRLEAKASPSPWEAVLVISAGSSADGATSWSESEGRVLNGPAQTIEPETASKRWFKNKFDAELIAETRNALPVLLAEIDQLRSTLRRAKAYVPIGSGAMQAIVEVLAEGPVEPPGGRA